MRRLNQCDFYDSDFFDICFFLSFVSFLNYRFHKFGYSAFDLLAFWPSGIFKFLEQKH